MVGTPPAAHVLVAVVRAGRLVHPAGRPKDLSAFAVQTCFLDPAGDDGRRRDDRAPGRGQGRPRRRVPQRVAGHGAAGDRHRDGRGGRRRRPDLRAPARALRSGRGRAGRLFAQRDRPPRRVAHLRPRVPGSPSPSTCTSPVSARCCSPASGRSSASCSIPQTARASYGRIAASGHGRRPARRARRRPSSRAPPPIRRRC